MIKENCVQIETQTWVGSQCCTRLLLPLASSPIPLLEPWSSRDDENLWRISQATLELLSACCDLRHRFSQIHRWQLWVSGGERGPLFLWSQERGHLPFSIHQGQWWGSQASSNWGKGKAGKRQLRVQRLWHTGGTESKPAWLKTRKLQQEVGEDGSEVSWE